MSVENGGVEHANDPATLTTRDTKSLATRLYSASIARQSITTMRVKDCGIAFLAASPELYPVR
jgi:hypothetical protein